MASQRVLAAGQTLYRCKRRTRWDSDLAKELPDAYRKFWREWKHQKPVAVHYTEVPGRYKRNEETGEVNLVQNVPLPLKFPKEYHKGIWGGEAVIQGFQKKKLKRRRVPHFWIPSLQKEIVYSEVLNKYMRVVITPRTLRLIHENYGFDHYLLKTPACDLGSKLALKIKREILTALADETLYPEDPEKRKEVYETYRQYLASYTREEIEWYGLSFDEALIKQRRIKKQAIVIEPLKIQFRSELIAILRENKIKEAGDTEVQESSSWLSKLNPFGKSSPKAY